MTFSSMWHRGALLIPICIALTWASSAAQADSGNESNCLSFAAQIISGEASSTQQDSQATNAYDSCMLVNAQATNAGLFSFDYGVPHSPALTLAGLSTDKVTPATSLKPFVLSLPGLLGSDGTSTGAALDIAPAWAFDPNAGILDYQNPDAWLGRIWYRTRVSTAFSKGDAGGSDPTKAVPSRAAIGISFSLADGSDPVMARTANDLEPVNGKQTEVSHWLYCLTSNYAKWGPKAINQINALVQAGFDIDALSSNKAMSAITFNHMNGTQLLEVIEKTASDNGISTTSLEPIGSAKWDDPSYRQAALSALPGQFNAAKTTVTNGEPWKQSDADAKATIQSCQQEASDVAQHGADLQIGAGVVLQGTPGTLSNLSDPNGAAWIAGRLPFSDLFGSDGLCDPTTVGATRSEFACWTIGGSGRYSAGEMDATGDTTTPMFKANVAEGWIGIERIDTSMKLGGYFGYMDQSAVNVADKAFSKSGTRWLFSGAYSLSNWVNGLWVVGSYGNANGSTTTLNDKVALLSLTFGPPKLDSGFMQKDSTPPAQ